MIDRYYCIEVSPEDMFYCIEVSLIDRFCCIEVSLIDRFYCIEVSLEDRFYCIEVSLEDRFCCIEVSLEDRFYCIEVPYRQVLLYLPLLLYGGFYSDLFRFMFVLFGQCLRSPGGRGWDVARVLQVIHLGLLIGQVFTVIFSLLGAKLLPPHTS